MGFVNGLDTRWFKDRDVFGMVFHDPKSKVVGVLLQLGHKKVTLNHLVDVCFLCWFCLEKCLELVVFSQQKTPTMRVFWSVVLNATPGWNGIPRNCWDPQWNSWRFFGWIYGESLRGGHWSQVVSRVTWAFPRGLFGHCVNLGVFKMFIPKKVILEKHPCIINCKHNDNFWKYVWTLKTFIYIYILYVYIYIYIYCKYIVYIDL